MVDLRKVPFYDLMLTTPGEPKSEFLRFEADEQPPEGAAIFVDGRWAGIREAIPTASGTVLLDCRRFYRFALVEADGASLGDYFHQQPTMEAGTRFMPDENTGRVVRVLVFDSDAEYGFDGVLVVEPFDD